MLQVYSYIANKDRNIGFRKDLWRLDGENIGHIEGGNKSIWILLEDTGCHSVCARTDDNTVFFLFKNFSTTFSDKENWYINFAIESDQDFYDVWRKICAAFIVNNNDEINSLAERFLVQEGKVPYYEFDYLSYVDHFREIQDVEKSIDEFRATVPGMRTPSWKKLYSLLQKLQNKSVQWCDELYFLVPEVTKEYFYKYCELQLPNHPTIMIEKKDWISLLNHKEPMGGSVITSVDNKRSKVTNLRVVVGIATLVVLVIGISIGVYHYIEHINRQNKKGARKR